MPPALPFWASVSTIVSAKLCVSAGSPDQVSAGKTFCPLQLPNTCANAIGLPLLTFVEDTVNSANAGLPPPPMPLPKSARASFSHSLDPQEPFALCLFDHLVGLCQQQLRHGQAEFLGRFSC
jgi:hypothetical protein